MGKTIICHCEDITLDDLHSSLRQGYGDLETIKRFTGIATGKCQGKCCLVQLTRELAKTSGGKPPGLPTIRQPVLPLRIEEIAEPDEKGS
jgi:bacterioferritin-associated ferredoxin